MVGDPSFFMSNDFVQIYYIQPVTVRYFLVTNTIGLFVVFTLRINRELHRSFSSLCFLNYCCLIGHLHRLLDFSDPALVIIVDIVFIFLFSISDISNQTNCRFFIKTIVLYIYVFDAREFECLRVTKLLFFIIMIKLRKMIGHLTKLT
jgi:hypothetical protein